MEAQKLMKCMHFNDGEAKEPANLKITELPIPVPDENEVLLKVLGSSVNRLDLMQASGKYIVPDGVTQVGGLDVTGYIVDPETLQPTEVGADG
jgi:NADPH:quinone reductase-like Zn-dependent oxidoreductase